MDERQQRIEDMAAAMIERYGDGALRVAERQLALSEGHVGVDTWTELVELLSRSASRRGKRPT